MRGEPDHPPSARVRLEVAFLGDSDAPLADPEADDARPRLTVLVVAAEADVRRYVGECLRSMRGLRLLEASNAVVATAIAEEMRPDLLVVDEPGADVLNRLPPIRTIVIVDEVPYGANLATPRIRVLGRPFSAEQLTTEVDFLLMGEGG